METQKVTRLFIGLLIILPLQHALVGVVGQRASEPWPAFVLPGFKSVYDRDNTIDILEPSFRIVTQQRDTLHAPPSALFYSLPHSQLQGFLRTWFSGRDSMFYDDNARGWLRKRVEACTGLSDPATLLVVWTEKEFANSGSEETWHIISERVVQHRAITLK